MRGSLTSWTRPLSNQESDAQKERFRISHIIASISILTSIPTDSTKEVANMRSRRQQAARSGGQSLLDLRVFIGVAVGVIVTISFQSVLSAFSSNSISVLKNPQEQSSLGFVRTALESKGSTDASKTERILKYVEKYHYILPSSRFDHIS